MPKPSDTDLLCVSNILQGLLASGHYTRPHDPSESAFETPDPDPYVISVNHGKDWKEDGLPRPHFTLAVSVAIELFEEMKEDLGRDYRED